MDEWMRAWQSLAGGAGANPWTAALDHFTQSQSRPVADEAPFAEALSRITEQSRSFFELGETLARSGNQSWQQSVFEYLDELSRRFQDPGEAAALGGFPPLDYWRRFAGHGSGAPTADQPSFMRQVEELLRMPGLGYTREHQEDAQALSRLWLAYEAAYGEYAAYCAETARRSVERLRGRLAGEFEAGRGPGSLRAVYDAWVTCCEEVYAERAADDEYMKLHGAMVNSLMAYRRQAGKLLDRWARAANLPTREEVDALHRKLKDTRQELNALKARLNAGRDGEP